MTDSFETAQRLSQDCISKSPVIILGSGASAAHGIPGMGALATHLSAAPPPVMSADEASEWGDFVASLSADDLETALTKVSLSESQTEFIVGRTRSFLLPYDQKLLAALLENKRFLPLSRLYRHLFASTHKTIDVITPNYDRLAEYAADAANYYHFSGFSYGYLSARAPPSTRVQQDGNDMRTVCVWKVHGSLDWFRDNDHQVISAPSCHETPANHHPLMITPGIEKYRTAYNEPFRTIMSCSDNALERARSYLCVGFGFNDDHLQTKLVERCDASSIPIVVISKVLTETARSFLFGGRCRKFLAIEESPTGSRIYTNENETGEDVPGHNIWTLPDFLDMTIGFEA